MAQPVSFGLNLNPTRELYMVPPKKKRGFEMNIHAFYMVRYNLLCRFPWDGKEDPISALGSFE